MKKFVFVALAAVFMVSSGQAKSNVNDVVLKPSELNIDSTIENVTVIEYYTDELRCYERTCYYQNGRLLGCTAWKEFNCDDLVFDGGQLDPVIIVAPKG